MFLLDMRASGVNLSVAQYTNRNTNTCARLRTSAGFIAKNNGNIEGKVMQEQDLTAQLFHESSPAVSISTNLNIAIAKRQMSSDTFQVHDEQLEQPMNYDIFQGREITDLNRTEVEDVKTSDFVSDVFKASEELGQIMHPDDCDHRDEELLLAYAQVKSGLNCYELGTVSKTDLQSVLLFLRDMKNSSGISVQVNSEVKHILDRVLEVLNSTAHPPKETL